MTAHVYWHCSTYVLKYIIYKITFIRAGTLNKDLHTTSHDDMCIGDYHDRMCFFNLFFYSWKQNKCNNCFDPEENPTLGDEGKHVLCCVEDLT